MSKEWRHAIVGMGVVGDWHARVISKLLPGSTLTAVCDIDSSRAKVSLERQGVGDKVRVFRGVSEMLRDAGDAFDIVHICTPSGAHVDPATLAMDAKKHVICEKPMEVTLERIDQMIAAARRNEVRLAGIFQNRWNPANRALKLAADEGRFGTLAFAGCYTPWHRSEEYYRDGGWRGTWQLDGGGAMMNQSVHAVDLLQWIAGPVNIVSAYAGSRIHPEIEVEDTLACALTFESGAFGVIMGSTAMWPGGPVRIELGGSSGTAVSEGGLKVFSFHDNRESDAALLDVKMNTSGGGTNPTDVPQQLHADNMQHILDAWERDTDPETSAEESRKAIAIILAMYESARAGGAPILVQ